MKNWDPLLLGPALAMDKMPTEEYLNESKRAFAHISYSTMTKTCREQCAPCCHLVVKAKNIIFYLHKTWRRSPFFSVGRFLCEYELVEIKSMMITRSSVLQFEVLIWKLPTVDGLSSSAIVVSEISSLKARVLVRVAPPPPHQSRMTAGDIKVERIKNCTWHMNWGMTRWKIDPL